jgi:hypothetical protein
VVHANVSQNVTPHSPSLGLFLNHFFTYNGLVTSQVHPHQHKQPTKTTTMVMELLAFQWHGFNDTTPPEWGVALRIHFSRPLSKGLGKFNKLM